MKVLCFIISVLLSVIGNAQVITTIAGTGISGFSGEGGSAISAQFAHPVGVASDKYGNIYIADRTNNVIQKIDAHGVLSRFAGNSMYGESGDGGPATAASLYLGTEVGMVADSVGNVFIAAEGRVRKINTSGIISTVAGKGSYGYSGDGGPATAAEFAATTGLCFDKAGNLYIADEQNSNVRIVNTAGIISTIAGTTIGFSGDGGPATNAQLKWPAGIATDASGNLYIADAVNYRVRKVSTSGIITTIAGVGIDPGPNICYGCDALTLQLAPTGITVDQIGNVYVSDIVNSAVHKITPGGKAYTIAGTGVDGFSGDGGPATAAKLKNPKMIYLDKDGNLLITDKGNIRYRKVWVGTSYIPPMALGASVLHVFPNPAAHHAFTLNAITPDTNENVTLVITDVLGKVVTTTTCTTNIVKDISLPVPSGMYFISATTTSGTKMSAKVVVE